MSNNKFEIKIVFKNNYESSFSKILEIAKRCRMYSEIKIGETLNHVAIFDKSSLSDLAEFYSLASDSIIFILINGKIRPYTRELWLPMLLNFS